MGAEALLGNTGYESSLSRLSTSWKSVQGQHLAGLLLWLQCQACLARHNQGES